MLPARLREFVAAPLRRVDEESLAARREAVGPDAKTMVVLLTVAVALVVQEYLFNPSRVDVTAVGDLLAMLGWPDAGESLGRWVGRRENAEFARLAYWVTGQYVAYVVIPVPVVWFVLRERLADYGVGWRNAFEGAWLYAAMFAVMLPLVWYASTTEAFRVKYPFYRLAPGEPLWPRFLVWELLYAVQFVALEFFFRGFLLHGTKHRFGSMAIFVMMVPYCMIHFGKPMAETFGAIGAGIVLGFTSLKTRSIWLGAAIHIGVAWTMDTLATFARLL